MITSSSSVWLSTMIFPSGPTIVEPPARSYFPLYKLNRAALTEKQEFVYECACMAKIGPEDGISICLP